MANIMKPTTQNRVEIPPPQRGIWSTQRKSKSKLAAVLSLAVMGTRDYPVKGPEDVQRLASILQSLKSPDRDFVYRTIRHNNKVFFRVWRTV